MRIERWQLAQRQSLSLEAKVAMTLARIRAWHAHWHGQTYVAFSGGKDSTVLLDLVRSVYPSTPAVFANTGLEYPEVISFVKSYENVVWLRPKLSFKAVIEKYGYPIVSKNVSMAISRYRNTKREDQRQYRLHGRVDPVTGKKLTAGVIPKRWQYLLKAPFKISEQCCDVMKKGPFYSYNKETGRRPYIGTMASDSNGRTVDYLRKGCNFLGSGVKSSSRPMSFWFEDDVWAYIRTRGLKYAEIYDKGVDRTGCMFCMFGMHTPGGIDRFENMKVTHPKLYTYCMEQLGLREVLKWYPSNVTEGIHGMVNKEKEVDHGGQE